MAGVVAVVVAITFLLPDRAAQAGPTSSGMRYVGRVRGEASLYRYRLPDGSYLALWGSDGIAYVPSTAGW